MATIAQFIDTKESSVLHLKPVIRNRWFSLERSERSDLCCNTVLCRAQVINRAQLHHRVYFLHIHLYLAEAFVSPGKTDTKAAISLKKNKVVTGKPVTYTH